MLKNEIHHEGRSFHGSITWLTEQIKQRYNTSSLTKSFKIFASIILALVSIYFVEEMVLEFLAGITAYSFSHHNLTPRDNPSVVVCFDLTDKSLDVGQNQRQTGPEISIRY